MTKRTDDRAALRAAVEAYKTVIGCEGNDCEEQDPALEFHHRDPLEKVSGVGRLISDHATAATVWAEIEKCDVLCRPCHIEAHRALREARRPSVPFDPHNGDPF